MQRANLVVAALFVTGTLACATPGQAQVTVGADLGAFSSYVWRGITYTNKFVLQPDAYLTVPVGNASITAGGWFNIEPGKYDGATDISESGGQSSFDVAEFDWWGEVGYPVGKVTLTAGVTGYLFPNDFGFTKAANTVEIYGKAALDALLSPKLAVWYDVDKIKGAYFEGSISHSIPASEKVSVTLGALAGLNAGQGIPSDPLSDESFNFADDGFTHLDLSAAVPFAAGPLSFSPAIHFVITGDDATKFTKIDETTGLPNSKDVKVWGGVTISWSRALGPEPETTDEAK
jgi:hypothetical protein